MKPRYDPRVFLALRFSRTTQERLLAVQEELKPHLLNWHFTPPDNFHLTLRFFGELPPAEIDEIDATCQRIAPTLPPFALHLSQVDFFGTPHTARVLFVTGDKSPGLDLLLKAINDEFPLAKDQRREFRPHVTLAKARSKMERSDSVLNSVALRRLREKGRIGPETIGIDAQTVHREFILMETVWVGRAVEYTARGRYKLGDDKAALDLVS